MSTRAAQRPPRANSAAARSRAVENGRVPAAPAAGALTRARWQRPRSPRGLPASSSTGAIAVPARPWRRPRRLGQAAAHPAESAR